MPSLKLTDADLKVRDYLLTVLDAEWYKPLSQLTIGNAVKIHPGSASRCLQKLCATGFIERVYNSKHQLAYRLAQKGENGNGGLL